MLIVSLRPHYLPREFPTVVTSCVYIPPNANTNTASELVAKEAISMLAKYPGAPVLIMGDYNRCRLDTVLPSFHQYVDTPTRKDNILDLCYGNIADAFRTRSYPPLGLSDHNMICLLPVYKQELKKHKPETYSAPKWTEDAIAQLQGSLACTNWDTFDGELNDRVSIITDYINFCIQTTIPVKKIKKYPNSKPWITPQLRKSLKEKHRAFKLKDWVALSAANRAVKNEVFKAKLQYKNKLEQKFSSMNTRQAFQMAKTLTGSAPRPSTPIPPEQGHQLNIFFNRFDADDYTEECCRQLDALPLLDPNDPAPFSEEDVRRQLRCCKPGKAPGPDGISARVLKTCATELSAIIHSLFCEVYHQCKVPTLWKTAIIIPVPKKPRPKEPNDYRPIALTSILMKCLEYLLLHTILPHVRQHLDPLQFAYKAKRGTEDAVACLLHLLLQHLDSPCTTARILFADFSSAFNTIQRHLLIQKLLHLNVPSRLIHLLHNFLTNRKQTVRVSTSTTSKTTSPALTSNTGAPQGCVLSPFLFTLYTNDCTSPSPNTIFLKYADDTAILGLLTDNHSTQEYLNTVSHFTQWCLKNDLKLNVSKTKEMVFGSPQPHHPIITNNETVETVDHFKYLGLTIDNKLTFEHHTTDIHKKGNQRLSAVRKLKGLHVAPHLLLLLYTSIVQPILLYCSTCFFNMLTVKNRNRLTQITNTANKIIGLRTPKLQELNDKAIARVAHAISLDITHPLNRYFSPLPSGRRFRTTRCNKARFSRSLIPSAIQIINKAKPHR